MAWVTAIDPDVGRGGARGIVLVVADRDRRGRLPGGDLQAGVEPGAAVVVAHGRRRELAVLPVDLQCRALRGGEHVDEPAVHDRGIGGDAPVRGDLALQRELVGGGDRGRPVPHLEGVAHGAAGDGVRDGGVTEIAGGRVGAGPLQERPHVAVQREGEVADRGRDVADEPARPGAVGVDGQLTVRVLERERGVRRRATDHDPDPGEGHLFAGVDPVEERRLQAAGEHRAPAAGQGQGGTREEVEELAGEVPREGDRLGRVRDVPGEEPAQRVVAVVAGFHPGAALVGVPGREAVRRAGRSDRGQPLGILHRHRRGRERVRCRQHHHQYRRERGHRSPREPAEPPARRCVVVHVAPGIPFVPSVPSWLDRRSPAHAECRPRRRAADAAGAHVPPSRGFGATTTVGSGAPATLAGRRGRSRPG